MACPFNAASRISPCMLELFHFNLLSKRARHCINQVLERRQSIGSASALLLGRRSEMGSALMSGMCRALLQPQTNTSCNTVTPPIKSWVVLLLVRVFQYTLHAFLHALAHPTTHPGHYDDVFVSKFKKLMSVFPPDGTRTVYALRRSVS